MGAVVVAIVAVVVVAAYLSWTASRLDRLHARVDAAAEALDAQLVARALAAIAVARARPEAGPAARELEATARAALSTHGLGDERNHVENALSEQLLALVVPQPATGTAEVEELAQACTRVAFALTFHADAVQGALVVRERRIPRVFGLAGSAPMPTFAAIDQLAVVSLADLGGKQTNGIALPRRTIEG